MADVILRHHEWYDGTGYPGRLAGESIPLGGRIVAVADTVDAAAVDRPISQQPADAVVEGSVAGRVRDGGQPQPFPPPRGPTSTEFQAPANWMNFVDGTNVRATSA